MNKLSNELKFRILAIISCVVIVIGMALGTVLHFVSNGFFNYGGEYSSYKSITVSYSIVELNGGDVDIEGICADVLDASGVKYYAKTNGSSFSDEKQIEYRFSTSVDNSALQTAVKNINNKLKEVLSKYIDGETVKAQATLAEQTAELGGGYTLWRAAVALAVIVVAQLIYTMIRFRFSAAFTAIAIDLHNIALYAAVLALCRVPVSSSALVFGIILTLVTVLGVTFMLERIKRNAKENANIGVEELAELSARQTRKTNIAVPAILAVTAVLFFVATAISSLSVIPALIPMALAFTSFAVAVYGNVIVAPYVYIFIKNTGKKIAAKPSKKKGN